MHANGTTLARLLATDWHEPTSKPFLCFHGSGDIPTAHEEVVTLVRLHNGPAPLWRVRELWYRVHRKVWDHRVFLRAAEAALADPASGLHLHYVSPRCRLAAA